MVGLSVRERSLITCLQAYRRTRTFYFVDCSEFSLGICAPQDRVGWATVSVVRAGPPPRETGLRCRPTIEQFALRPQALAPKSIVTAEPKSLRATLAPGAKVAARDFGHQPSPAPPLAWKGRLTEQASTARRLRRDGGNRKIARSPRVILQAIERPWNARLRHQSFAGFSAPSAALQQSSGCSRTRTAVPRTIFIHFHSSNPNKNARFRAAPARARPGSYPD